MNISFGPLNCMIHVPVVILLAEIAYLVSQGVALVAMVRKNILNLSDLVF